MFNNEDNLGKHGKHASSGRNARQQSFPGRPDRVGSSREDSSIQGAYNQAFPQLNQQPDSRQRNRQQPPRLSSRPNLSGQSDPSLSQSFKGVEAFADNEYSRYTVNNGSTYGSNKTKKPKKGHKKALIVVIILVVLLAVLGVFAFSVYNSAKTLKSDASVVMRDMSDIQSSITSGQYQEASKTAHDLAATSAKMKKEMDSPVWGIASVIPYVGSDVSGVKTLVEVLSEASTGVLVPLTSSLESTPLDGLIDSSGAIDVSSVEALISAIEETAPAMDSCATKIESIPAMNISQLEDVLGPAKDKISGLNDVYQAAASFSPVVGSFLGKSGERTYLIAAQNSAEIRSSGGYPGKVAMLRITDGKISIDDFSGPNDVFTVETPSSVAPTENELTIFSPAYMNITGDTDFDPNFERVAGIWAASYAEKTESGINGVISITPAILQDILKVTGGVTLADGTQVDGSNATKVLQHDLYWKYMAIDVRTEESGDIVDALFADAGIQTFDKLLGSLNANTLSKLATSMLDGMKNREVMLYLTDPNEQSQIESLGISGQLNFDSANPKIGTFASIWIPSKMGWYMDIDTQIGQGVKNADGTTTYEVTTTYRNTITASEAASGGSYIMGERDYEQGDMQPFLYLYAPTGGTISNLVATNTSTGTAVDFAEGIHDGLQMFYIQPKGEELQRSENPLLPGQSIVCTYTVTVSADAKAELDVMKTPTLTEYR